MRALQIECLLLKLQGYREKSAPLTAEGGRHLNKFVNGLFDDELAAVLYDNSPIGCIDALSR